MRGAAVSVGAPHTQAWLKSRLLLHHGHAKRLLETARALHDDPTGPLVQHSPEEHDHADTCDSAPVGLARLRAAFALRKELGSTGALLDWSGPISAEAARRLACDARVVPVVLGGSGQPLDVGRSSYTVTAAIWRALVARDRGCAFAGCDRPPEWTEAHHNGVHWADGGDTSVENCCLLCDFHHRLVHHHGWRLELVDGQMWTIPPPWVDPARTARRNTGRDTLADLATLTTRLGPPHVRRRVRCRGLIGPVDAAGCVRPAT